MKQFLARTISFKGTPSFVYPLTAEQSHDYQQNLKSWVNCKIKSLTTPTRFNLGFLFFGPLEQCKDGALMKYAEHERIVSELLFEHISMHKSTVNDVREHMRHYCNENAAKQFSVLRIIRIGKKKEPAIM